MSRAGYRCLCMFLVLLFCVLGRDGARKRRRWIRLISVDGFPPSLRPSGAGLALGTRVCCSLCTPSRAPPHRGRVSSDGRRNASEHSGHASHGLCCGCQRHFLGHSPQKRPGVPARWPRPLGWGGSRGRSSCRERVHRRTWACPTHVLDGLRHLLQAQVEMPPDCGRGARGPGAFAQGPAGMGGPRLGEAALAAPLASEVCRRGEAQRVHQRSGGIAPGEVAACGHRGHRHRALHPAPGLEGFDHGSETPSRHLVGACLCKTLKTSGCSLPARMYAWNPMGCAGVGQPTARSHRRCAGPQVARPVERIACRSRQALRRNCAALRSRMASARARHRSRIAASSTVGTETGVRSPERIKRASVRASRRLVVTRSPGFLGINEGR